MTINSESARTDYSTYILSRRQKFVIFCGLMLSASLIAALFYRSPVMGAAAVFIYPYIAGQIAENLSARRRQQLLIQFKDCLYSFSSSVSTGRSMAESIKEAYENLRHIYDDKAPMVRELEIMVSGIESRESEIYLMSDFAARSGCRDISGFTDVYISVRESGGDMEKAISRTCEILMDKITIDRDIRAMVSQKKTEARIITMMPVIILAGLNMTSADYILPLYETAAGRVIMTGCLAAICFAYYLTEKITDLKV